MKYLLNSILICCVMLFVSACDVDQTEEGSLPDVDVEGGNLPDYDVEGPDVSVESQEKQIEVPDVEVESKKKTVEVPDVDVDIPEE